MAKDGTNRGGPRIGSGTKSKSLIDRIEHGKPVQVLTQPEPVIPPGVITPKPDDYLAAKQRDGSTLRAKDIYDEVYKWLRARGCDRLVNRLQVQQYSICIARHIQCEEGLNEYGLISQNPVNKNPLRSPFAALSLEYLKQANQQWLLLYQVVKENCSVAWTGPTPHEDIMENLLKQRGGE